MGDTMKAAYATFFLGLCAVVLLVHQNIAPEEARAETDPFIANLEAHVVAKAQRRLRAHEAHVQEEKNIAEARKTMQMMLTNAADSAQQDVQREEVARQKQAVEARKPHAKKKFTWDELQAGADSKPDSKPKVQSLLNTLKSAPRTHKEAKAPPKVVEAKPKKMSKKSALSALTEDFEDDSEEEDDY